MWAEGGVVWLGQGRGLPSSLGPPTPSPLKPGGAGWLAAPALDETRRPARSWAQGWGRRRGAGHCSPWLLSRDCPCSLQQSLAGGWMACQDFLLEL